MHKCTLCNEHIDENALEFGDAIDVEGEFWHTECFDEYFEEALETA